MTPGKEAILEYVSTCASQLLLLQGWTPYQAQCHRHRSLEPLPATPKLPFARKGDTSTWPAHNVQTAACLGAGGSWFSANMSWLCTFLWT